MAPFVHITAATVDCLGVVNVTYETGATPALAPENEHVVMFSPASNPAAVTSHRLLHRPVNGTFNVAMQAPTSEAYRVFVVSDFEPANLEGVVLVDEFDARSTARRRPTKADRQPAPTLGGACRSHRCRHPAQRGSGGGASGPRAAGDLREADNACSARRQRCTVPPLRHLGEVADGGLTKTSGEQLPKGRAR